MFFLFFFLFFFLKSWLALQVSWFFTKKIRDLNDWMIGKLWVSCWMKLWISWRGGFSSSDSTARWQCRSFNRWTARICSRMTGQILTSTCFNKACCLVFLGIPGNCGLFVSNMWKNLLELRKWGATTFFLGVFVPPKITGGDGVF